MFECRALKAFALLACIPLAARGQNEAAIASARAAVDSAREALQRVYRAKYEDSVRRATLPIVGTLSGMVVQADTAAVGSRIIKAIEDAHRRALALARHVYGPVADTLLSGLQLTVTPGELLQDRIVRAAVRFYDPIHLRGRTGPAPAFNLIGVERPDVETLQLRMEDMFIGRAARNAPSSLVRWNHAFIPLRVEHAAVNRAVYIRLATNYSVGARECLDGSIAACRWILRLPPADPASPDLQRFQTFRQDQLATPDGQPLSRAAACGMGLRSCRLYIETLERLPVISMEAQGQFVRMALDSGGDIAYGHLVADSGSAVDAALAAVSGVPIDTLVAEWREGILEARKPSPRPTLAELALTMAVGALGFLAIRRRMT